MMRNKKYGLFWIILLSMIMINSIAIAQDIDGMLQKQFLVKKGTKSAATEVYKLLDLSENQKMMLEKNRNQYHRKIKNLNDKINMLKRQLNIELEQKSLNKGKIDQIKANIDILQAQLSDLRLKGIMDVREILTPEQYKNIFRNDALNAFFLLKKFKNPLLYKKPKKIKFFCNINGMGVV